MPYVTKIVGDIHKEPRDIRFKMWSPTMKIMFPDPVTIDQIFQAGVMFGKSGIGMDLKGLVPLQNTNVADKKKRELYDGDIVLYDLQNEFGSVSRVTGIVAHPKGANCVTCSGFLLLVDGEKGPEHPHDEDMEWIGNIFQNPELLTNK